MTTKTETQLKYSPDGVVTFSEKGHIYTNTQTGERMQSVSAYKKKYCRPFDPDGTIKARYAAKHGMTVEEVTALWNFAGIAGTSIHLYCELYALEKWKDADTQPLLFLAEHITYMNRAGITKKWSDKHGQGMRFCSDFIHNRLEPVHTELICYDLERNLAGQVDLLARSKKDNELYIIDYKTNNSLTPFPGAPDMLAPVRDMNGRELTLPDTTLHGYYIQQNAYRQMLEAKGTKIKGMYLVHIDTNNYRMLPVPKLDVI